MRVSSVRSRKAKIPIRQIDDETAMETGAELIGEASIYFIAVLVLISETIKWTTKASEKEAAEALASEQAAERRQQHEKLIVDVEYLKNEVSLLRAQLDDVTATGLRKCKPSGDK